MNNKLLNYLLCVCLVLGLSACSREAEEPAVETEQATAETMPAATRDSGGEETQALVLLRGLPTLDTTNSVAIVEMDPEAENFGAILYEFETPNIDPPLHHIYYSPTGRAFATALDPKCSLVEIRLARDASGSPVVNSVDCIDTGGQQVGEDIMWHTVGGNDYMFVTFMGGTDVEQSDGGTVAVLDAQSLEVIKIIEARKSKVGEGEPFIMYPHGLSAYGDRMVVTSTIHPDLATGVGNSITVIDLNTLTPIESIVVEESKPVGFPSSPVEVLFVRPSIVAGVEPAVLVNTMFGFETWRIAYDEANKTFAAPVKIYDGVEQGTGVPLEFYGNETELFISHSLPGVVKRYELASLPELVSSGSDIVADAGAHHMIFYSLKSGRKVIAVQNNLLNLGNAADNDPTDIDFIAKVNAHTVTVHDLATGEKLGTVDFRGRYDKGIDNIEGLFTSGFVHHH
jgi:hypothetical protein